MIFLFDSPARSNDERCCLFHEEFVAHLSHSRHLKFYCEKPIMKNYFSIPTSPAHLAMCLPRRKICVQSPFSTTCSVYDVPEYSIKYRRFCISRRFSGENEQFYLWVQTFLQSWFPLLMIKFYWVPRMQAGLFEDIRASNDFSIEDQGCIALANKKIS